MLYSIAAAAVLILHFVFIVFVALGGGLVAWRRRLAWLHLPAVCWGVFITLSGTICPLTPLEQSLRLAAGEAGYAGGFIDHYLMPLIYPPGLTRTLQVALGITLIALNGALYAIAFRRAPLDRRDHSSTAGA